MTKMTLKEKPPAEIFSETTEGSIQGMKQVHIILQGKGGVGKSLVASLVAQYLRSKGDPFVAIDTDPNNATLSGYKSLNVKRLEVMKNGSIIERNFDSMIEQIVEEDSHFVIDNGSSNFSPFKTYMVKNNLIKIISDRNKKVFIHTVIKGGQELRVTLAGFDILAEQLPAQARIVVWLNEHIAEVKGEGKAFEEMKLYKKYKDRVNGMVRLEYETSTAEGQDMKQMLSSSLTFDEVKDSPDFSFMPKTRLLRIRDEIFSQLEKAIQ